MAGITFYDWGGKPALIQGDAARVVPAVGATWIGEQIDASITAAAIRSSGINVGRDEFKVRFSGPPWNVPDLEDWFVGSGPDRPFDSYAIVRVWAFRH